MRPERAIDDAIPESAPGAAARLARLTPPGHTAVVHLTLTDDHPWAEAQVIIEAIALAPA